MRSPSMSPPKQSFLRRIFSDKQKVDPATLFHLEQQGHSRQDATAALVAAKSRSNDIAYVQTLLSHQEHTRRRKDLAQVVKVGDKIPVNDMWEPSCIHCEAEKKDYADRESATLAKWDKQASKPPSKITRFSSDEEVAAHYLQVSGDYAERAKAARKNGSGGAGDEQLAKHYLGLAQQHAEKARHTERRGIGHPNVQEGEWESNVVNNQRNREMAAHNAAVLGGVGGIRMKPAPEAGVRKTEFLY